MRRLMIAVALLALPACTVLSPTTVNNNGDTNGGGSATGPSSPCAGAISSINLDIESGVSGDQSKIGDVVALSADPRGPDGKTAPVACLTGQVTPVVTGVCTLNGPATLAVISVTGTAAGNCAVSVNFAGVGSNTQSWTVVP